MAKTYWEQIWSTAALILSRATTETDAAIQGLEIWAYILCVRS